MSLQNYTIMKGGTMRNDREHQEQKALFQWAALNEKKYPELRLLFAVPNGSHKHIATAVKFKAEGLKSGVPDICLPVARGNFHGLFIEMKIKPKKPSPNQRGWLTALETENYATDVCYSWDEARQDIITYLKSPESFDDKRYDRLL